MKNTGTATMPQKVCTCPFCGATPEVTPYPNNTGASVKCPTIDCATWGATFDLEDWNRRTKLPLHKYLFHVEVFFEGYNFHKSTAFRCKECGATDKEWENIKHKEGCNIARYFNDTP